MCKFGSVTRFAEINNLYLHVNPSKLQNCLCNLHGYPIFEKETENKLKPVLRHGNKEEALFMRKHDYKDGFVFGTANADRALVEIHNGFDHGQADACSLRGMR